LSSRLLSRNVKVKIYKTIILPVLYGCETWYLKLREEHRLRIFENRVLRRIFRPKRDEVTGEWRKLNNELHIYRYASSQTLLGRSNRGDEVGRTCGTHGRGQECVQGFGGKPEGKRPLERPRRRRVDIRETDLGGGGGVDPVDSGLGPVAGSCKYDDEPRVLAPRS
jgi:hypothetical protein